MLSQSLEQLRVAFGECVLIGQVVENEVGHHVIFHAYAPDEKRGHLPKLGHAIGAGPVLDVLGHKNVVSSRARQFVIRIAGAGIEINRPIKRACHIDVAGIIARRAEQASFKIVGARWNSKSVLVAGGLCYLGCLHVKTNPAAPRIRSLL